MRETVVAAAVQTGCRPPAEKARNVEAIRARIDELAGQGVELAAFPELGVTNFFCEEGGLAGGRAALWEVAEPVDGPSVAAVAERAAAHRMHVVLGLAERGDVEGVVYNTAVLVGPDGIVGVQRKGHAAGLEKLYYTNGGEPRVFETPLGRIGIAVCYDAWHPEYVRALGRLGAEIVVCINSVWKGLAKGGIGAENKQRMWELLPVMRAFENGVFFVACNGCGSHFLGERFGTWERMGRSRITDPHGNVLAASDDDAEAVVVAELHAREIGASRAAYPMWADRRPEVFAALFR